MTYYHCSEVKPYYTNLMFAVDAPVCCILSMICCRTIMWCDGRADLWLELCYFSVKHGWRYFKNLKQLYFKKGKKKLFNYVDRERARSALECDKHWNSQWLLIQFKPFEQKWESNRKRWLLQELSAQDIGTLWCLSWDSLVSPHRECCGAIVVSK